MIDVGSDVEPVIAALRSRDVLPGRKFPSLPNWLRVTIGTPNGRVLHPLAHGILVPTPTLSECADTGTAARPAQCGSALH